MVLMPRPARLSLLTLATGVVAAQSDASNVRGVAPGEASAFTAAGDDFRCLDGRSVVPRSAVNDDFCDCADGSDEPGTGACGALESSSKPPGFYCPNDGGAARYIYPSRVGDGICDCCDGSDEWQAGASTACRDVCKEKGRARQLEMEERRKSLEKGIEKRRQALAAVQGQGENWKTSAEELRGRIPKLEEAAAKAKEAANAAQAQLQAQGGATASSAGFVSEYAKWMDKDSPAATGERKVSNVLVKSTARRELRAIKVRCGDLIDFVDFEYATGPLLSTGGGQGNAQEPFILQEGEAVAEVRIRQGGLMDGVQFVTTAGRESLAYGGKGGEETIVKAKDDEMIIGFERDKGGAPRVKAVLVCDREDRRSPEEKAHDAAQEAYDEARVGLQEAKQQLEDLEAKMRGDYSDSKGVAYGLLGDKCVETNLGKYRYKICVDGDAKQDYTNLGTWRGWQQGTKEHIGVYDGGSRCPSGTARSLRATFECGEEPKILQVREPSQCAYAATVTHPAACDPAMFDIKAPTRILQPHEHDEL
eukprot:TRINITY_DN30460_c0_g2_i1.p1 TRINITY_DN30460_c0_g2~~TRINITY_DN30460_c0_g2_i1.p1  ORF type:complete len:534 (-),score=130.96 TRINITY_DN30460_c0_g2_i1:101-1702(-)